MGLLGRTFEKGDALLLVDVQIDFCPGGTLPIAGGDRVVPILNEWIQAAEAKRIPIYASRDYHPLNHVSFKAQGGPWPPHCIQDTVGARFHPALRLPDSSVIITKGVRFDQDQNSAFEQTGLAVQLRRDEIKLLLVGGLALDVCVLATVLDALKEGFSVTVIEGGTRPVTPEGGKEALAKMKAAGAEIL
jgi:nicotinamidase/pyrazinamidase